MTGYASDFPPTELAAILQTAIAPRPVGLISTIDRSGVNNLSPFSFFNLFSLNPPVCIFSPSRRMRDGTTKHTLENLQELPECVVNVVTYDMVQQTSLASCDFPQGVDEFKKTGFKPIPSVTVKPMRVAESPVQFECLVKQIIPLGNIAGSGNLVVAEINYVHCADTVVGVNGKLDQAKLDVVGRLGADFYTRANQGIFTVTKPNAKIGIGVDALPEHIRNSTILTGNQLGVLANGSKVPQEQMLPAEIAAEIVQMPSSERFEHLQRMAAEHINLGEIDTAWAILLSIESC